MIALWGTSGYAGRRSHDKPASESNSRSSSPDGDHRASSSSDATPRPTPAPHPQHLASVASHDPNFNLLGSSLTSDFSSSSRRLGFFTEKLSAAQASHSVNASASGHAASQRSGLPGLLHSHNHPRTEPASSITLPSASIIASLSGSSNSSKLHSAPSKVSPTNLRTGIFNLLSHLSVIAHSVVISRPPEELTILNLFHAKCIAWVLSRTYLRYSFRHLRQPRPPILSLDPVLIWSSILPRLQIILGAHCMYTYCPCSMENPLEFPCRLIYL
jgi:hypothetical protein